MITVIEEVPARLRAVRLERGLSFYKAAREVGVSFNTIRRFENKEDWHTSTLLAVLRWIGGHKSLITAIERVPERTRSTRQERGLSVKVAAEQIGVNLKTLTTFEQGIDSYSTTLLAVLRWLDSQ